MGKETVLLKSEEQVSKRDLSKFLAELATKVEGGKVLLLQGEEKLALSLPEQLVMEVKVEEEEKGEGRTKHSLEIELEWYEEGERERLVLG